MKIAVTYTQRALTLTTRNISHFRAYDKPLVFIGSASPSSQCTSKELFPMAAPLSASITMSAVAVRMGRGVDSFVLWVGGASVSVLPNNVF